jgi:hypothetical protein
MIMSPNLPCQREGMGFSAINQPSLAHRAGR